jgi:hypothetical protein
MWWNILYDNAGNRQFVEVSSGAYLANCDYTTIAYNGGDDITTFGMLASLNLSHG